MASYGQRRRARTLLSGLLFRPLYWPRWVRRAGMVLFPFSIVVWALIACGAVAAATIMSFGSALDTLWNGHRRYRYRYDSYSYAASPARHRHINLAPRTGEPDPVPTEPGVGDPPAEPVAELRAPDPEAKHRASPAPMRCVEPDGCALCAANLLGARPERRISSALNNLPASAHLLDSEIVGA